MNYTHIPQISCFYSEAISPDILHPAAHFEYELILVTGGNARAIIEASSYDLGRGSLVLISRLERHNFLIADAPYCRYVASLSSELLLKYISDPRLLAIFLQRPKNFRHAFSLEPELFEAVRADFERLVAEDEAGLAFCEIQSVFLIVSILVRVYRSHPEYFPENVQNPMSAPVLAAQRYISEHFHRKLNLAEVASHSCVSPHALSGAFRDLTGASFKEYLLLFRLTEAKKLLVSTELSVREIAERVGYINVNNFVRLFGERERITPLQYRKQFALTDSMIPKKTRK